MIIDKLRTAKEAQGLTNHDIALMTGIPESSVTRILSGQTESPSYQSVVLIAKHLGVSLDESAGITAPSHALEDARRIDFIARDIEILTEKFTALETVLKQFDAILKIKNKWLFRVFLYAVLMTLLFIVTLLFDAVNPTFGYITR